MVAEKVKIQIAVEDQSSEFLENFRKLCSENGLEDCKHSKFALVKTPERMELRKLDEPKLGAIYVDFLNGALAHRRKFGGGRGEAIAKAVGIKGGELPKVLDSTAGLGRDAFVLASIGCEVAMVERHPVVRMLLADGLERAYKDEELGEYWRKHLQLLPALRIGELISATYLNLPSPFAVVYLDPMFPHRQKSALVKKEMRVFQELVGADLDSHELLSPALELAQKRVVVKRPDYAEYLTNQKPSLELKTKNHRFDIYFKFT